MVAGWGRNYYDNATRTKIEADINVHGATIGTREMAIAACKAAIDKWLGPKD